MEFEDLDFSSVTPPRIRAAILDQGCAVLRRAIPQETICRYKAALLEIYELYDRATAGDQSACDLFQPYIHDGQFVDIGKYGNVSPQLFDALSRGQTFLDLFADHKLQEVIQSIVGRYQTYLNTFVRVAEKRPGFDTGDKTSDGIQLHTDGVIQGDRHFALTVWIAFDRCGQDAPGLTIIADNHKGTRKYVGFKGGERRSQVGEWDYERYSKDAFAAERVSAYYRERMWRPILEPGDAVLFTNWTLHATHRTSAMRLPRIAAITRFEGNTFNPKTSILDWLRPFRSRRYSGRR